MRFFSREGGASGCGMVVRWLLVDGGRYYIFFLKQSGGVSSIKERIIVAC